MDQNSKLITLGLNEWLFRRNYSPENKKVRKLFHWQRTSWSNERTDSIKPTCYQIWGRFSETFCETSTSNGYLFLVLQFFLKFEPKLSHFADQIVKTYPTPSNDPSSFKHSQNWDYTLNHVGSDRCRDWLWTLIREILWHLWSNCVMWGKFISCSPLISNIFTRPVRSFLQKAANGTHAARSKSLLYM